MPAKVPFAFAGIVAVAVSSLRTFALSWRAESKAAGGQQETAAPRDPGTAPFLSGKIRHA
jgi:hypothetical protein